MFSIVTLALIVVALYLYRKKRWIGLPPGPNGFPLVGYLPFLSSKPHVKFLDLKKKYGPVYSLTLGSLSVIVLTGFEAMKEAFNNNAFYGRETDTVLDFNEETKKSGAFGHFPWKDQRRFILHVLRDLGMVKPMMEENIADEIHEFIDLLANKDEKPIFPAELLTYSISNVIDCLVFGKRRGYDDPKRIKLCEILKRGNNAAESTAWITYFPILKKVVSLIPFGKLKELKHVFLEMKQFVREESKELRMLQDSNTSDCFIAAYLKEIDKNVGNPSTFKAEILEDMAILLFGAGSETVSNTVNWLLLATAAFPDVQKKICDEIESVIGFHRFPTKRDQKKMPYTEAVIHEILRWRATPPIMIPRYTLEETKLNSYFIPKDVPVLSIPWAVHHDPDLWGEDVESFKPERFLYEDGSRLQKPEYYIPFSLGKRACPGMFLAYMEIFLYFVAILQKFQLKLPAGKTADFEGVFSITLKPKPQQLCFEKR